MCPKCGEENNIECEGYWMDGPDDTIQYWICVRCGHQWEEHV